MQQKRFASRLAPTKVAPRAFWYARAMTESTPTYIGRFAPTPSGPLHQGSLAIALASWLDARAAQGRWLVRIDDIDPPREAPGGADQILRQLEACGLHWDGSVRYQSRRNAAYDQAITLLLNQGDAFFCPLSRTDLAALDNLHPGISVATKNAKDSAVRLQVSAAPLCFEDRWQGIVCTDLQAAGGAFVIRRRDRLYAYQLACALDDADDGITVVVRGIDLIDSTPRQLRVLQALGRPAPRYGHLPLVTDNDGSKLAKSSGSAAVPLHQARAALAAALLWLGGPTVDGDIAAILAAGLTWWRSGANGLRQEAGPALALSLT